LIAVPFMLGASTVTTIVSVVLGAALVVPGIHRGAIRWRYDSWNRLINSPFHEPAAY
jgi:uncharacterized membrane protein